MRRALDEPVVTGVKGLALDRKTNAALTLARLGRWERSGPCWTLRPDPTLRTRLIRRLCHAVPPSELINGLARPDAPMIRQAVLLALGGYPKEQLSAADRSAILDACPPPLQQRPRFRRPRGCRMAATKLGPGRGARRTDQGAGRPPAHRELVRQPPGTDDGRRPRPDVPEEESPGSKADREPGRVRQHRRNGRRFAIAAHEVTVEEFQRFKPDHEYASIVTPGVRAGRQWSPGTTRSATADG